MTAPAPAPLKRSEINLVRNCLWARTQVPTGDFLPAPRWWKAARSMAERGYLTAGNPVKGLGGDWPVVKLTEENWAKLRQEQPQAFAPAAPEATNAR